MSLSICVLGEKDSGKSSLIFSLAGQTVNFNEKKSDKIAFDWDHDTSRTSFVVSEYSYTGEIRGASILLIVFDTSETLQKIADDIENALCFIEPLKNPHSAVVAVGTKSDKLSKADARRIYSQIEKMAPIPFYFVSTNQSEEVKAIFEEVGDFFLYYKLSHFVEKYKEHVVMDMPTLTLFPAAYERKNLDNTELTWELVIQWALEGHVKTQQVLRKMGVEWSNSRLYKNDPANYLRKRPQYFPQHREDPKHREDPNSLKIVVLGPSNAGKTCFIDSFLGQAVNWDVKKRKSSKGLIERHPLGEHTLSLDIEEFKKEKDFLHTYHVAILILDFSKDPLDIQRDFESILELHGKRLNSECCLVCVGTKAELKKNTTNEEEIRKIFEAKKNEKSIIFDIPLYFARTNDKSTIKRIVRETIELFLYYSLTQFKEHYNSCAPIPRTGINSMFSTTFYPEKDLTNSPPLDWNTVREWAENGDKKTRKVLKEAGIDWRTLSEALIDPHSPTNLVRKPEYLSTLQMTESEERTSEKRKSWGGQS
jgi:GTPase SAR1 family protein